MLQVRRRCQVELARSVLEGSDNSIACSASETEIASLVAVAAGFSLDFPAQLPISVAPPERAAETPPNCGATMLGSSLRELGEEA